MAQKRMFSLQVVETDKFCDMPTSAQCLYFHLGMHGDDDGFVASPKRITTMCGCNPDDLSILVAKGYVVPFDSGVLLIRDWRINNTLKNDRYRPTIYEDEKRLILAENPACFQNGSKMVPQHNITQPNKTKQRKEKKSRAARFTPPSVDEVREYCQGRGNHVDPEQFVDFYASKGWKIVSQSMKDWKAAVRTWERRDNETTSVDIRDPRNYTFEEGESL